MQPRGWRGDRPSLPRKHGLIPFAVFDAIRAFDIRRKRHMAQALDRAINILAARKTQHSFPAFPAPDHFSRKPVAKTTPIAALHFGARPPRRPPLPRVPG